MSFESALRSQALRTQVLLATCFVKAFGASPSSRNPPHVTQPDIKKRDELVGGAHATLKLILADLQMHGLWPSSLSRGLLVALGCEKKYNVTNPFDWMVMISLQGKTNFFEKRVGEYSKAGVGAVENEGVRSCVYLFVIVCVR